MNTPNDLGNLLRQEHYEAGLLLTQYAEQARLSEVLDEGEEPWRYNPDWAEFGQERAAGMANALLVQNPFINVIDHQGSRKGRWSIYPSIRQRLIEFLAEEDLSEWWVSRGLKKAGSELRLKRRKALLSSLNKEHDAFKAQMRGWLAECHSRCALNQLVDLAISHDKRMASKSRRPNFSDTFQEMVWAFFETEDRIRKNPPKPLAVVVDTVYHPAKLRFGQAISYASSPAQEEVLVNKGWVVVARAKSRS